jgi:hypothetical protein
MLTRPWAARQLNENLSETLETAFALAIEMWGALCEDCPARKTPEVLERGDENTRTAAQTAINAHLALNMQEAIKEAIVSLLRLAPGNMARSPPIPFSPILTCISIASTSKCPGILSASLAAGAARAYHSHIRTRAPRRHSLHASSRTFPRRFGPDSTGADCDG